MLRAVYYPHTAVRDENFLKHALLYWDEIECISPSTDFDALAGYSDSTLRELASILKTRTPTEEEKNRAHQQIMKLLDGDDLPQWLKINRDSSPDERQLYNLCSGKLLQRTWRELEDRKLVRGRLHDNVWDYAAHGYMGLTVMAILARCCAGDLKHTITDQDPSYFAMLKHLQYLSGEDEQGTGQLDPANQAVFRRWLDTLAGGLSQAQDETRGTLVSITLDVINVGNLPVNSLLELRTDKTQFAASLRRNYAEAIEEYVSQLTVPGLKPSDARALQEEFRSKMKLDMDRLFAELRLTGLKTLLSREVAIALAAPIAGATVFAASGLGSVLGGTLGMAALAKLGVEYRASRNAVFERHPMAFLYAQKGVRLY